MLFIKLPTYIFILTYVVLFEVWPKIPQLSSILDKLRVITFPP